MKSSWAKFLDYWRGAGSRLMPIYPFLAVWAWWMYETHPMIIATNLQSLWQVFLIFTVGISIDRWVFAKYARPNRQMFAVAPFVALACLARRIGVCWVVAYVVVRSTSP